MFIFNKPLELPPQLEWKFAHEPELMSWTIKARNYNIFVANGMFLFMAIFILGCAFIMYSVYEEMDQPWRTLSCIVFGVIMLSVISSMTHQRMNFAFRFTRSGFEHCKWKDFPEWALTFLKWLAGVTAIIFLFLATIDPSLLLGALIGPGGIGLTYLSMACSKNYRELHTHYHHYAFEWKELTQLAVVINREIVDLKYSVIQEGEDHITKGGINIFCKRKQKEKVAEFIKPYLSPDVPCIKIKADVPQY
ncbi:hypothetical protein [Pseudomonas sp. NUPR-001]|uniref:hypothetical protein n=1 Tax=Pseudomonas sp. NUPR-001 TaxID=3416058 RepID=UPI003F94D41B